MKNKFYYLVLMVGVVLVVISFIRKDRDDSDTLNIDSENTQKQEVLTEDSNDAEKSYLEGVLYNSEDANRGNLRLSSNDGEIYIRTSRDFSALLGFQVMVLINGTKDNFELVDVQSNLAKDGFIRQR